MIAVFQREFKSYFNNMIGFVIVAAWCFFIGYSYCVYNVSYGYPYFGIALAGTVVYLLILTPILTMRSLSDERKTKTDQMLLTAPVSVTQMVLGKFLAMAAVFAIPLLISCIYPILLQQQTYHSLAIDAASMVAFFLLGCAYISIGMFISSLTESQIISAVISFAVFYLMSAMENITANIPDTTYVNALGFCVLALVVAVIVYFVTKNLYASIITLLCLVIAIWAVYFIDSTVYAGLLATVLNTISLYDGISYFANGIINVQDLVLFLSVIVIFVFLTVQSVQKRRWN